MVLDDGMSIVGSTWVVGYKPTGRNSVQNKGGLWLNEVGMEYTKKEMMMIDLSEAKVGDQFDSMNERYELLIKTDKDYVVRGNGDRLYVVDRRGSSYEPDAVKLISKLLEHGKNYQFSIGNLVNCLGRYDSNRKSFMNCGNKVCGASEATNIVKLDKASG